MIDIWAIDCVQKAGQDLTIGPISCIDIVFAVAFPADELVQRCGAVWLHPSRVVDAAIMAQDVCPVGPSTVLAQVNQDGLILDEVMC